MPRILLADDHAVVRQGLRDLLGDAIPGSVFGEAATASATINAVQRDAWDLLLLDLSMPGAEPIDLVDHVRGYAPKLPILVLSARPVGQLAVRLVTVGVEGYVEKTERGEVIVGACQRVLSGKRHVSPELAELMARHLDRRVDAAPHAALSDRELQVLRGLGQGHTVSTVGESLGLSVKTISTYRARLLEKMGFDSNADLVRYVRTHRLYDD